MKKNLLFLFIIASVFSAKAQQTTFTRVLWDAPMAGITEHAFVPAIENGCVIAGETINPEGLIIKIDSAANIIWSNAIGTNCSFHDIKSTYDSCYIVTGSYYNTSTNKQDIVCVKINSAGNIIWSKELSSTNHLYVYSLEQTFDSGFAVAGYLSLPNGPPYSKIFVAKLDNAGNLQWSKLFSAGTGSNEVDCIRQTQDSNLIVSGYYNNYQANNSQLFIFKLTSGGAIIWAKEFQNSSFPYYSVYDILYTYNGILFYLSGGSTGMAVMKTDYAGNFLWCNDYSASVGPSIWGNNSTKIHKTNDSSYVFVTSGCMGSNLVKIDSLGNVTWSQSLWLDAVDVTETNDHGFFITGNGPLCGVKTMSPFSAQIGIIKIDSAGNAQNCIWQMGGVNAAASSMTITNTTFTVTSGGNSNSITLPIIPINLVYDTGCVSIYGGINENNLENNTLISPNPFSTLATLQTSISLENATLTIYNSFGQQVKQLENISGNDIILKRENLPGGLYFIQVKEKDKKIASKKIIIE